MESRLFVKADAGAAEEGHRGHEGGVESELARELGLVVKAFGLRLLRLPVRRVEVAVHPLERAVDFVLAGNLVNLGNRGTPGVPRRLRVRPAEALHELLQPRVRDHRQMRARVSGIDLRAAAALEQHDRAPRRGEQIGGREPSDAAADDDDVGVGLVFERRERRNRG